MSTWIARVVALIAAIMIFAAMSTMLAGASGGHAGRALGGLLMAFVFALAFIWFPDEMSDYTGLSQRSFSGGPGPQILYACGWIILVLLAGVALVMRLAA